ncbi:MAG: RDD family protein [Solirubrobacteraceae bacterium]
MTATPPDPFGTPAPPPPPDDPFGPPPGANGPSGPRAGFGSRLGAYLIDFVLLLVVGVALSFVIKGPAGSIIQLIIGIVYFTYLEGGVTGQTLGKKALGIRVYDLRAGGSIGYGRAFIRYIGRIVSFVVVLLGYLWMLWDSEKQTWHDKFAGSVVVPTSAYPVQ